MEGVNTTAFVAEKHRFFSWFHFLNKMPCFFQKQTKVMGKSILLHTRLFWTHAISLVSMMSHFTEHSFTANENST